jgi:hypothetical protein
MLWFFACEEDDPPESMNAPPLTQLRWGGAVLDLDRDVYRG